MFPAESKKSKKSRKSAGIDVAAEVDAPEPVDVLVDTVIGFLEKATAYMRAVANQVFWLLTGSVRESTIDLILAVCSYSYQTLCRLMTLPSGSNWNAEILMSYSMTRMRTRRWRKTMKIVMTVKMRRTGRLPKQMKERTKRIWMKRPIQSSAVRSKKR